MRPAAWVFGDAAAGVLALAGCMLLGSAPAGAATSQTTFNVTATVVAACSVSAADLAFGSYNPTAAGPTDAQSDLTVTCTNGTTYNVGLDAGGGSGATIAARKMTGSSGTLTYALYRNAGRTLLWGTTIGTDTLAGTGSGAAQTLTVYGRAPAAQTALAGGYSDVVGVTVTF